MAKVSLNAQIKDDYFLGGKFEHNLEKFTSIIGQVALRHENGDLFLRADLPKEEVVIGGTAAKKLGGIIPPNYQGELHIDYT